MARWHNSDAMPSCVHATNSTWSAAKRRAKQYALHARMAGAHRTWEASSVWTATAIPTRTVDHPQSTFCKKSLNQPVAKRLGRDPTVGRRTRTIIVTETTTACTATSVGASSNWNWRTTDCREPCRRRCGNCHDCASFTSPPTPSTSSGPEWDKRPTSKCSMPTTRTSAVSMASKTPLRTCSKSTLEVTSWVDEFLLRSSS
mmetsp:Transcript_15742/g.44134  ORF Transcript_15742/g.44134 Transcript_15742/m.44134 type:complete len:201 (+) Transcript_15742:2565-3167(+)